MSKYQLISISEAAHLLGIKKSTAYTWVNQRRIPYLKMGHLVKFDVQKLEEWIARQQIEETRF